MIWFTRATNRQTKGRVAEWLDRETRTLSRSDVGPDRSPAEITQECLGLVTGRISVGPCPGQGRSTGFRNAEDLCLDTLALMV